MTSLTGTRALIRLALRRDRVRLSVWVLSLAFLPILTAASFAELYPTEAARRGLAATVAANPSLVSFLGPLHGTSIGALTAWRLGALISLLGGIMAILTVVRHTREEEESGRRELLGSTVLGRHAQLLAAAFVAIGAGATTGVILAIGLVAVGEPTTGSVAFGAGFAAVVTFFAGVGALVAQVTERASVAKGIGIGVVGLAFLLRVAGDGGSAEWLSWLSPIGWFVALRSFAEERWWVFGLWLPLAGALTAAAFLLSSRRDVGAGVIATRPGDARAGALLSHPLGLAWRLQRGSLMGWTVGLAVVALIYGSLADGIDDFFEDSPQLAELFENLGGEQGLIDGFFAAAIGILALIASAYAIRAVLKMLGEEGAQRVEPVLATATSRVGWVWSHLVFGVVGTTLMLLVGGAVAGAAYGAVTGDVAEQTLRVMGSAAVHLPAVWVLTGVAMAFYGLAPRLSSFSWGVLVWCLLLGQLGQILQLPQWALNLSPFSHVPFFPAEDLVILPILALVALAAALTAGGVAGFMRRDIPAT